MKIRNQKQLICLLVILGAGAAGFIDGVIQPPYFIKAALKAGCFSLAPLIYFLLRDKSWNQLKELMIPKKQDLTVAVAMGLGVFGLILGAYWASTYVYDISGLVLKLTGDAGVRADNFLWVSLYISLVNSWMEEFLFRGFGFLTLKKVSSRRFAYVFSALAFSLYHVGMMAGGSIWISLLAVIALWIAGILFNWLNEERGTIVTSWLVHMFANAAINTVACMIFGIF